MQRVLAKGESVGRMRGKRELIPQMQWFETMLILVLFLVMLISWCDRS